MSLLHVRPERTDEDGDVERPRSLRSRFRTLLPRLTDAASARPAADELRRYVLDGHPEAAAWVVDDDLRLIEGPIGASPLAASTISADPLLGNVSLASDDDLGYAHLRAVGGSHAYSEISRGDRDWLVRIAPRRTDSPDDRRAVAVAVDVTELTQRQAALIDAAKTLSRTDNPNAVVASLLGGVCARLGWHTATLWLVDPETDELVHAAQQSLASTADPQERRPAPGRLAREVRRLRTPRQRGDGDDAFDHDDAACAAPVTAEGTVFGVLELKGTAIVNRQVLRALEAIGVLLGQYLRLQQATRVVLRANRVVEETGELAQLPFAAPPRDVGAASQPGDEDEAAEFADPELASEIDAFDGRTATAGNPEVLATLERVLATIADDRAGATIAALERISAVQHAEQATTTRLADFLRAIAVHTDRLADAASHADGMNEHLEAIRAATVSAMRLSDSQALLRRGAPLALVVSPDAVTQATAADTLAGLGFVVLSGADAAEAEVLSSAHRGLVSLLLTDLIIPPTSAARLAGILAPEQRRMKLVYLARNPDPSLLEIGPRGEEVEVIRTPVAADELVAAVGAAFAARRWPSAAFAE